MQKKNSYNTLNYLIITLVILWLFLFMCTSIWDNDIWWHLKTGKHILETRNIPKQDIYTYTCSENKWINLHWFYQVTQYLLYEKFGTTGLIFFQSFIIVLVCILLVLPLLKKKKFVFASLILFVSSFLFNYRAILRPENYSYMLFTIYLILLEQHRKNNNKIVYIIPFLQIIWTNTQGIFILGLILISIFLFDSIWENPKENSIIKSHLFYVLILSIFACFINPYFSEGVIFPLTLFTRISGQASEFKVYIDEFKPLSDMRFSKFIPFSISLLILVVSSIFMFLQNHYRKDSRYILLWLIFFFLMNLAIRNVTFFVIIWLFLIAKINKDYKKFDNFIRFPLFFVLIIFFIMLISGKYYPTFNDCREFSIRGIDKNKYPINALNFIKNNKLKGKLFNHIDDGGYIIWNLYPDKKVFIDTRLEVIEIKHFKEYLKMLENRKYFEDRAKFYSIKIVIIREINVYLKLFYLNPKWKKIFFDEKESSIILYREGY